MKVILSLILVLAASLCYLLARFQIVGFWGVISMGDFYIPDMDYMWQRRLVSVLMLMLASTLFVLTSPYWLCRGYGRSMCHDMCELIRAYIICWRRTEPEYVEEIRKKM